MSESKRNQSACVVIPCYRAQLENYERVALERCVQVLKVHPIVVIKPESLNLDALFADYPSLRCESFADECFKGISGYNRLLLSDSFYGRFADYEYMLIHQLDAFVFHDALAQWCDRGYDYIGAPWLPHDRVFDRDYRLWLSVRRRLFRWMDKKHEDGVAAHHAQYLCCAGNGGFSLRRIEKMRSVLAAIPDRANRYRNSSHYSYNEDMFFCVEANRFRRRIRIPPLRVAAHFSWESQPTFAAILTQGDLPFGCHGWHKLHRDEWRPIFRSLGYDLDAILGANPEATNSEINSSRSSTTPSPTAAPWNSPNLTAANLSMPGSLRQTPH